MTGGVEGMLLLPWPPMKKSGSGTDQLRIYKGKAMVFKTAAYNAWKGNVAAWLKDQRLPVLAVPCRLDYIFVVPDNVRRDIDNACTGLLDAGNGILWTDDSLVHVLHGEKRLDRSVRETRLLFKLTALEEQHA